MATKLQKVKALRAVSSVSKLDNGSYPFNGVKVGEWNIPEITDTDGNVRPAVDIPYLGLKTAQGVKGLPLTNIFFACKLKSEGDKSLDELMSDDYVHPNDGLSGTLHVTKDSQGNVSLSLEDVALAELVPA